VANSIAASIAVFAHASPNSVPLAAVINNRPKDGSTIATVSVLTAYARLEPGACRLKKA
jgi:hypothetical protein